jgi:hypothetical protein
MEHGIELWGTASMGALRAAELHPYGMHGFGEIFQDFKDGILQDDDEVAVLHLGENDGYTAINDAMVNIRSTCQKALDMGILTPHTNEELIHYCKAQFYPYRSLMKAAQHLSKSAPNDYVIFLQWLAQYGIVDLKKENAKATLQYLSNAPISQKNPAPSMNSMTCFLRELILFANTTPFKHNADWLPDVEQELYALHQTSPLEYMLLAEIVSLLQKLVVFSSPDLDALDLSALSDYVQKNQLYQPENDFFHYKNHPVLSSVYALIYQSVCLTHLSEKQLDDYLPALEHYYDLPKNIAKCSEKPLKIILVLIFAMNAQMNQSDLAVSKKHLQHHLKQLKKWRQYSQAELKNWLINAPVSQKIFNHLLQVYLMASSVHALSPVKIEYYQWIYDVKAMCYPTCVN